MNKLGDDKGITIIALIVTIAVTFILATISIRTLIVKNNSTISKANEATNSAQKESIIEKIEADLLDEKIKNGGIPSKIKLREIIIKNGYNEGDLGEDSFITKNGRIEVRYDEIYGWTNER